MKKLALVSCVCILGLITIYTVWPNDAGEAVNIQNLTGTALYNNKPAAGFSMIIIYPDHEDTITPDQNGHYTLSTDVDHAKELQILYSDRVVASYGPPFSSEKDYSANINVRGADL
jgi:hypothetical protein